MPETWDQLAQRIGANPAQPQRRPRRPGELDPGPLGGFIASALSAFPEFIGADPSPLAAEFRAGHPVSGFVSEALPLLVPYGGAYRLSQIPSLATRLEATTARIADPVTRPVVSGAVREMVRYAPLEAGRLAVGAATHPENLGNLFADVAFSEAFAGGFGAIGGVFRAGGRAGVEARPDVRDVDMYAAPTVQLRALREGAELIDSNYSRAAAEATLLEQALTEAPPVAAVSGRRLSAVGALDNARGPQDVAEVNNLFRLSNAESTGLRRQLLVEGSDESLTTLNAGEQQSIAAALGFADIGELAGNTFFPRLATAVDRRGAGLVARLLRNPTLQKVDDDLWLGRESGDGLHIVVRRLPRAEPTLGDEIGAGLERAGLSDIREAAGIAPPPTTRGRRPNQVTEGDRFLVAKTDRPGAFSPRLAALQEANYAQWARWRQAYQRPFQPDDLFNAADDELLGTMTPRDLADMRGQSRRTWVSRKSSELTRRLTQEANLTDSAAGRQAAEALWDIFAPTMFKQGRNSLYARFEGLLRNRVRAVTQEVNRMFIGANTIDKSVWRQVHRRRFQPASPYGTIVDNFAQIPDDELELVVKAAITQTPADDLASLSASGAVSPATAQAVRNLQALDQDFLSRVVYPALEAAGERDKFKALEGYIMPVIRLGDDFQNVLDETGRVVSLVSGRSVAHAQRQADAIVAEAGRQGRTWSTSKAQRFHATEYSPSELDKLFADTARRIGTDEDADRIVRDALKRLQYTTGGRKRKPAIMAQPPGAFRERTGLSEVVDLPSRKEILESVRAHYDRLGRFAAIQGWSERWGGELSRFQKYEPSLWNDVMRKRNQYLGIDGQITQTLNRTLEPVLGPVLGPRAATRIAEATNKLMYNFNLAFFNPTFAVLNALSPIMTTLPQIAYTMRGSRAEAQRLMQFIPVMDDAGRPIGSAGHLSPLKILWQAVRDMRDPEPQLRQMLQELTDDGSLHAQLFEEYLGANARGPTGLRESFKRGHYVEFFSDASTYMARKSEEFARVVSANAGFRLGRDAIGLEGAQLKNFTRRFVESTNYLYGVTDRPRFFTGPVGSVFGLFKNWQMHYLGMMTHYAGLAWKENVWSPLLWQSGAALALGGLGATPLRHIADGIAEWHGNDRDGYRWMLENWPNAADEIWFGLPSFLGVSLQASGSIPGTDVRNEITQLGNIVVWERAKQLGTAIGGAMAQSSATGGNPLENPNVRDELVAATMPRAVNRIVASVEGDYVRSMRTGYPQVRDVSPAGRMLNALGVNMVEIERQQIASRDLWRDQTRRRELVTGIGSAYAQAALRGDQGEMERLMQRSIVLGLPLSSIMRSAQNYGRRETQSDSLSRYDRAEAMRWSEALEAGQ